MIIKLMKILVLIRKEYQEEKKVNQNLGSPRILLFISSMFGSRNIEKFTPAFPNQCVECTLEVRFNLISCCNMWKENVFISSFDSLPGISISNSSVIRKKKFDQLVLSNIKIRTPIKLSKWESIFLKRVYKSLSNSYLLNEDMIISHPTINERRIHIGVHNGYTFLSMPTITNLFPNTTQRKDETSELYFNGNISLNKYCFSDPGIAIIFMIEYRLLYNAREVEKTKKKSSSSLSLPDIAQKNLADSNQFEKSVIIGWGVCNQPLFTNINESNNITMYSNNGMNPFSSLIYQMDINEIFPERKKNDNNLNVSSSNDHLLSISFNVNNNLIQYSATSTPVMGATKRKDSDLPNIHDPSSGNSNFIETNTEYDKPHDNKGELSKVKSYTSFNSNNSKRRGITNMSSSNSFPENYNYNGQNEFDRMSVSTNSVNNLYPPTSYSEAPPMDRYFSQSMLSNDDGDNESIANPQQIPISNTTRAEKARLIIAGFSPILDEKGKKPIQIGNVLNEENSNYVDLFSNISLDSEDSSLLRLNDIWITLMGVTFYQPLFGFTDTFPKSLYFGFQFYTFPYMYTKKLELYTGQIPHQDVSHRRSSSVPRHRTRNWSQHSYKSTRSQFDGGMVGAVSDNQENPQFPGILYQYSDNGQPNYSSEPGFTVNYLVNPNNDDGILSPSLPKNISAINHYLFNKNLTIDIWDGESMHYIGSASIPLRLILRQGKSAVSITEEIDIIYTEYPEEDNARFSRDFNLNEESKYQSPVVKILGKLYLRLTNIGRKPPSNETQFKSDSSNNQTHIIYDFRTNLKNRHSDYVEDVQLLRDIDNELNDFLNDAENERLNKKKSRNDGNDEDYKLKIVKQWSKKQSHINKNRPNLYQNSRQEKQQDLNTIQIFRERKKHSYINQWLEKQITTIYTIYPSLGRVYFFEYMFTNPYPNDHVFQIEFDDENLRVVSEIMEWKLLRKMYNIHTGAVDDRLINIRQPDGTIELFMFGNETVTIPFVFQSYAITGAEKEGRVDPAISTAIYSYQNPIELKKGTLIDPSSYNLNNNSQPFISKTINVMFLNNNGKPVSLLDIIVCPQGYIVDRSFRFNKTENEILRKTIRFNISSSPSSDLVEGFLKNNGNKNSGNHNRNNSNSQKKRNNKSRKDSSTNNEKFVCSNLNEVASSISNINSCTKEVSFKYKSFGSHNERVFYLFFYDDPYLISLNEIWRIFIHPVQRIDINCILGQTNTTNLVIKGLSTPTAMQCFSNKCDELMVNPFTPFVMPANALSEINLNVKPKYVGLSETLLNIVDVQNKKLISTWSVISHSSPPNITKSFEITLPCGRYVNKRVTYTNPYQHPRLFYLKTNKESRLKFKESVLELNGGETQYIGLQFSPCNIRQLVEDLLVFINDDNDRIEECLKIRIRYE
ncbi:hypothetical protein U3516DRAFT_558860 [Neocallimastix sp. 'constans']